MEKKQYKAGETVEGHVIVRCDDDFKHNGIRLTFKGREHTRIVVSHGKTTSVHTDEYVYFDETVYLEKAGIMPVGEKRMPFLFQFPDDPEGILNSYSGRNGWIEYTLEAVVEISRARDPKEKLVLDFRQTFDKPGPLTKRGYAEDDGSPVLDVELSDNTFCLGDLIPVRIRVAQDVKIREVRVEMNSNETVHAGRYKRNSRKKLAKQSLDDDYVQRGLWMDTQIQTDASMQTTFNRAIIRNAVSIKVTLNIPWARDKSVVIPINLGFCSDKSERETDDIFDF
jgi:hypothetical protein